MTPTQNKGGHQGGGMGAGGGLLVSNVSKSVISRRENGKKKINEYIVMKDIGKGSFAKVKLVLNSEESNKACAMKVLSKRKLSKIFIGKNRTALHNVMQEIAIMKKLVSFFNTFFH